jgi:hypothetical protein
MKPTFEFSDSEISYPHLSALEREKRLVKDELHALNQSHKSPNVRRKMGWLRIYLRKLNLEEPESAWVFHSTNES